MKRKIWFKAKPTADEGWIFGYYRFVSFMSEGFSSLKPKDYLYECHKIYDPETRIEHDVDPKTVCQFTGLTDKNGAEIYEGDKLQGYKVGFVIFEKGIFLIKYENGTTFIPKTNQFEIIGNIHDKN